VKGHGDRTLAPEVVAVVEEIHGEPDHHDEEVDAGEDAQRAHRPRMRASKPAVAHPRIPRDDRHQHEDRDLCGQQDRVGQQAGEPGFHVGQPGGLD